MYATTYIDIINGFWSSVVDAWYGSEATTRVARTGVGSSSEGGPCQSVCSVPSRCAACRKGPSVQGTKYNKAGWPWAKYATATFAIANPTA